MLYYNMNLQEYKNHVLSLLHENNKLLLDKLHSEGYKMFPERPFAGDDEEMIGGGSYQGQYPDAVVHFAPSFGVEGFSGGSIKTKSGRKRSGKGGSLRTDIARAQKAVTRHTSSAHDIAKRQATAIGNAVKPQLLNQVRRGGKFNLINSIKNVGHTLGKPLEKVTKPLGVGINPFDAGYALGHDVISPYIVDPIRGRGLKPRKFDFVKSVREVEPAGGKLKMPKALTKAGKSVSKTLHKVGSQLGNHALQKGSQYAIKHGTKFINDAFDNMDEGGALKLPKIKLPKIPSSVSHAFSSIGSKIGDEVLSHGTDLAMDAMLAAGLKRPKRKRAPSQRNMLISQLMKEHGMSLGQASRHIKENGLM